MLRLSIAFAAATILALLLIAAPARGQVAIGPGSVTAPFVHVEWGNGQVHVCAPFVNLDVAVPTCYHEPQCESTQPHNPPSAYPGAAAAGSVSREQIIASAAKLYGALNRFRTADQWQHYLAVAPGEALRLQFETVPASDEGNRAMPDDLRAALDHFDATANSGEYPMISSFAEFQQTRHLLTRFIAQGQEPVAAETANWSPASRQPYVGLPGFGPTSPTSITGTEELPTPPAPHGTSSVMIPPQN